MTVNLFHRQGPLDQEELIEFIRHYKIYGRHHYEDTMHLGETVDRQVECFVNEHCRALGNAADRLALTVIELAEEKKLKRHADDCAIHSSITNRRPQDGICNCGYGLQIWRETGNDRELYSEELKQQLMGVCGLA